MFGQVNQAGLLTGGAADGLANPPGGVGAEVAATLPVELLGGAHQAEIAFLDEVDEGDTGVGVAARDGDDETEVGFDETLAGAPIAALGTLGEDDFFVMREEREATNIVEVALEGVFRAIRAAIMPGAFAIERVFFFGAQLLKLGVGRLAVLGGDHHRDASLSALPITVAICCILNMTGAIRACYSVRSVLAVERLPQNPLCSAVKRLLR